jgi:site-specific DNA-methyltransferase (adenine-specific)
MPQYNIAHSTRRAFETYGKKINLKMEFIRTPQEIWHKLLQDYNFTVDACASDKNHLLPKYWTKENSALDQNWDNEIVYCHPMFDQAIPKFVRKAFKHNCVCVFLLPASTNAVYFHKYFWNTTKSMPRKNIKIEFLPRGNCRTSYVFKTEEGVAASRGFLRPLMLVHKLK